MVACFLCIPARAFSYDKQSDLIFMDFLSLLAKNTPYCNLFLPLVILVRRNHAPQFWLAPRIMHDLWAGPTPKVRDLVTSCEI